jgi:hypothetical protein
VKQKKRGKKVETKGFKAVQINWHRQSMLGIQLGKKE